MPFRIWSEPCDLSQVIRLSRTSCGHAAQSTRRRRLIGPPACSCDGRSRRSVRDPRLPFPRRPARGVWSTRPHPSRRRGRRGQERPRSGPLHRIRPGDHRGRARSAAGRRPRPAEAGGWHLLHNLGQILRPVAGPFRHLTTARSRLRRLPGVVSLPASPSPAKSAPNISGLNPPRSKRTDRRPARQERGTGASASTGRRWECGRGVARRTAPIYRTTVTRHTV